MKKTIWIGALLIAVAVLSAMVIHQNQQITRLNKQLSSVAAAKSPTRPVRAPRIQPAEPVPEPAPVEPSPMVSSMPEPAPIQPTPTGNATSTNLLAGLANMMKDPGMKQMMRGQQKVMVDKMYGSLAKYLNYSANQMETLNTLLLDRQMALMEAGLAMMGGSESDRNQALADTKEIKADYDQQLQDLLGPAVYPMFQQYEATVGERMQVQMFKDTLPAALTVTDQQETALIAAMHEETKTLPATTLVNKQTSYPSQLTEERVAETLKQLEQLQERYADRAATILSPDQLDQFTKWQQQWSAMQTMGLKMASQMFGNKNASPPSP